MSKHGEKSDKVAKDLVAAYLSKNELPTDTNLVDIAKRIAELFRETEKALAQSSDRTQVYKASQRQGYALTKDKGGS